MLNGLYCLFRLEVDQEERLERMGIKDKIRIHEVHRVLLLRRPELRMAAEQGVRFFGEGTRTSSVIMALKNPESFVEHRPRENSPRESQVLVGQTTISNTPNLFSTLQGLREMEAILRMAFSNGVATSERKVAPLCTAILPHGPNIPPTTLVQPSLRRTQRSCP